MYALNRKSKVRGDCFARHVLYAEQQPIALAEIAQRQGLSLAFLEQLFCQLRKRGLVSSVRGPTGGYYLSHSASTITIGMILQAVEEPVDMTQCRGLQSCQQGNRCLTHHLWSSLSERIRYFLGTVTLSELSHSSSVQQEGVAKRCRALNQ